MLIDEFLLSLPRPQPSAGLAFYNNERDAALALDPLKKANYEKYQASSRRTADVDYLPIKLDVENVSRCNFACKMCVVATWPKRQRSTDMSLESFKALIDDQYGLVEIKLNGLGEPTLQGDTFFEMIKYARSKRIWVRITTNSSLLHLNSNYKKLIDSDVCEIDISVDGHTKEVFEGIRVGSHFETVVKNCKTLNEYARLQGRHRTKMWTLVQQDNYLNLEHHVRLAAELGFKHAVFSLNLHGWGSDTLLEKNKKVTVDKLMTVERIESLMALAREVGITLTFWNVNSKFDTDTPANLCPWPFERAVVASDSKIVPCCMVADPNAFHFARDQVDTTVSQVWNSDEYRDFRAAHLKGEIPAICKGCYK